MHLCGKRLEDITISDIQALKSNAVAEGRSLDYKRDLPAPDKLKDYQGDVSAFANSGGGHLIFGINEDQGVPESIPGVVIDDQDELIRRLEATVRDGVEPRILGISYRAVPVDGGRHVFIVAIPAGWNPPHMVRSSGRFYARNAAGQHPMDVQEIRRVMLASEGQKTAIARWRTERLAVIQGGQGARDFEDSLQLVMHMAPIGYGSDDGQDVLSVAKLNPDLLVPVYGYHRNSFRHTADGLLSHDGDHVSSTAYMVVYRDGRVESVAGPHISSMKDGLRYFSPVAVEPQMGQFSERIRKLYSAAGIQRQWVIMPTLLNAKGLTIASGFGSQLDVTNTCDRSTVMLPEVVVTDESAPFDVLLRPVNDAMWNACGRPASINYNKEGRWTAVSV